ncbi:cytochrome P450 CYP82D47-like [Magnolia sinica]|uniref:cytochrome P450 CYP82D47-like n=1 Tax=Magnolia sinica TaxID=86752 RepID=UPI0026581216|nr:cytochrome P450 CYP82D47-like [Magnolia sinica]
MDLSLPFQAIAGLIALAFLYNLCRSTTKSKTSNNKHAPEPSGAWPILGHLLMLGGHESLARKFGAMADKYGPAFILRLGSRPTLVINSWELAKDCFTSNDKAFAGRPVFEVGIRMAYNNAMVGFAPYGTYWREVRKLTVLELLSSRRLDSLKSIRATEVHVIMKDLYGLWEKNDKNPVKVEMSERFGDITFNVIAMMVIGKRCFSTQSDDRDHGEAGRFRQAIQDWFHLFGVFVPSDLFPFLKWWDLKGYKKQMNRIFHDLDSLLSTWLTEHRHKKSGEANGHQDFLDVLISTVDGFQFSDYDKDTIIKATTLTAMTGGYDTTWITLTWTLSLLLNHRHVIKKAQDEMDNHVGQERNVEESDINNLVYLQAIIKESLRLYPAAPLSGPHEATEDCNVGGYHIRAGTRLLTNLWKIHRDPRVWSDPDEFQPERFLTKHAEVDGKGNYFEYLPFGSGRRMCPGVTMALQVLQLTIARLLHGFELRTPFDAPVDMTEGSGLTVPKETPLEVMLSPRLPLELYK